VKGKVVLDGRRRLHGLHLQGRTDVLQGARAERQGFWVVSLPVLVLGAEVEGTRVLEVRWEDNGLVAGFAGKLDAQVPRIERHERKLVVLWEYVLLAKVGKPLDGVTEGARVAHLVPGERRQACCGGEVSQRQAGDAVVKTTYCIGP
jgi:hypothetical protein